MELQSEENGEEISIRPESTTILGRTNASSVPTVSRRHVSLTLMPNSTLSFEIIGKNPILVVSRSDTKKVYRNGEKGDLREGDKVSLCIEKPRFWVVKREVEKSVLDAVKRREKRTIERRKEREEREREEVREVSGVNEDFEMEREKEDLDLSNIDPIEEFGFIKMGHEFKNYPRDKIRQLKNLNYYLEEPKNNSDNSEGENDDYTLEASTSKGKTKKRGKREEEEDEDWADEISEEEKDLIAKDAKKPKYATRSRDDEKPRKSKEGVKRKNEDVMLDEEDETLGGFIVSEEEEDEESENEGELENEEEEEFEDED